MLDCAMKVIFYYACRNPACEAYKADASSRTGACWRCGWVRMLARITTRRIKDV